MQSVSTFSPHLIEQMLQTDKLRTGSFVIRGRLVHDDPSGQNPLANMKVEVLSGSVLKQCVAKDRTDANGNFTLGFTANHEKVDVTFRVVREPHVFEDPRRVKKQLDPWKSKVFYDQKVTLNRDSTSHDFGTQRLTFYEYIPGWPRLDWDKENPALQPKERRLADFLSLGKDVIPVEIEGIHLEPITKNSPPLQDVVAKFPPNFTMKERAKANAQGQPDPTMSPQFMVKELFAGFNRPNFKQGSKPNEVYAEFLFNHLEFDGEKYLPNARLTLKFAEKREMPPEIVKVELQYRKGMNHPQPPVNMSDPDDVKSKLDPWQTFTAENPEFERALRAFRMAWNVSGQSQSHLTCGHILPEGFKIAADRNLFINPIGEIFRIFGYGLETINYNGATLIFGPTGLISQSSALTADAGDQDIKNTLGLHNYKGYKPAEPLFPGDKAAITLQKWYKVFKEYLDLHRQKYGEAMLHPVCRQEAERFSADLVNHSANLVDLPEADKYVDTKPFGDLKAPRKMADGNRKSFSPVVESGMGDKDYLDNIYEAALYFMMLTGPIHTLEHDIGAEECSDPFYGSMGGGGVALAPEDKLLPASDVAYNTVKTLDILRRYNRGFILANEDGIVPEDLLKVIKKHLPELHEGTAIDPARVRLGTRI